MEHGLRVGVIGCGYWGEKHLRVLTAVSEVTQVVAIDSNPHHLGKVAREYPSVLSRSSVEAALDDVDAVVVATPPESHAELALMAIEAKKHVFVEKPMTVSTAEADIVVEAAARAGVTLAVGHTFVHNAAVHKLVDLAQSGSLGKLHHINAARLNLGLYREDVNVIWDLAAHDISITMAVMGRAPDEVAAWGLRHTTSFAEDVASVRLIYREENLDSIIRVSWLDPLKVRQTTVVGSKKMAVYDDMAADERIKILDRGRERGSEDRMTSHLAYRYGDISMPFIDFPEPLRAQAEDFVRSCLDEERSPRATGMDGRDVVAVLEASDESTLHNGQPIPVAQPQLVGQGAHARGPVLSGTSL